MRPDYGCELHRLVFSPNDDTTAGLAIHYVRRALERWEPRVEVLSRRRHRDRGGRRPARRHPGVPRARHPQRAIASPSPSQLAGRESADAAARPPTSTTARSQQLVDEARSGSSSTCPAGPTCRPHDPGIVLLEVFAHLTETLIYRLNRLPEKAYVEFLRLIGVQLQPPAAASVRLALLRGRARQARHRDPRRHPRHHLARERGRASRIVFVTAADAPHRRRATRGRRCSRSTASWWRRSWRASAPAGPG